MAALTLTAIEGIPMVQDGDNVAELVVRALDKMGLELHNGDILTICQKIVSKSEGRVVDLKTIEPSHLARNFAARWDKEFAQTPAWTNRTASSTIARSCCPRMETHQPRGFAPR